MFKIQTNKRFVYSGDKVRVYSTDTLECWDGILIHSYVADSGDYEGCEIGIVQLDSGAQLAAFL